MSNRMIHKCRAMRQLGLILVLVGSCRFTGVAKERVWARNSENPVVGEYKKQLLGGVQIKDREGKTHLLRDKQLSQADLKYIEYHVPPTVEADVNFKTRLLPKTQWSRQDDKTEFYTFTVDIEKKSKLPYKGRMVAEVFILGSERSSKNSNYCVLMDYRKHSFILPDEKGETYSFSTDEVLFNTYYAYWIQLSSAQWRGKTYLGSIVSISDAEGKIIFSDASINGPDWLTDDLEESVGKLRTLYKEHPGSIESRHFRDPIKQVRPPAIPYFKRNSQL